MVNAVPVRLMSEHEAQWAGSAVGVAGGRLARLDIDGKPSLVAIGTWPNGQPIGDGRALSPKRVAREITHTVLTACYAIWPTVTEELQNPRPLVDALKLLDPVMAAALQDWIASPTTEGRTVLLQLAETRYGTGKGAN